MWRTTPLHRSETPGQLASDRPPELPDGVDDRDLQTERNGAGPLFHCVYRARIRDSQLSPEALVALIAGDPDTVAPSEFASSSSRSSRGRAPATACRNSSTGTC